MKRVLDIEVWMLLMVAMFLTACSDHSGEGSDEKGNCFLNIYVYAPEHPMLTRADVGTIASRTAKEHEVKTLQIWVFKHRDGGLVGYLEAKPTFLNETPGQEKFQIKVLDKVFADHPENVDVYVVANAGSCGLATGDNSLKERTKREELDAAMIGEDYFGVSTLVSKVPSNGLPMSGVLKNQSIYGSYPTLRVGNQDAMATLQLTRAVSKLRFVLCQKKEKDTPKKKLVSIDGIQLNNGVTLGTSCQIPTESYLMPVANPSYATYVSGSINYGSLAIDAIPKVKDPMVYAYETQSAQDYEDLINHAADEELSRKDANIAWLNDYGTNKEIAGLQAANFSASILAENGLSWPQLKELGLTYLRESDKKLTGTIKYTVQELEDNVWVLKAKTATFSMANPGDFLRNRSWIVYVFYMDATIYTLTVTNIGMKSWGSGESEEKSVYNW
jgi:hypothetical protein